MAFDISVDFSNGFVSAQESFKIIKTLGSVNKEALKKIAKGVQPSPAYIKEMSSKIESYLRAKESKLQVAK